MRDYLTAQFFKKEWNIPSIGTPGVYGNMAFVWINGEWTGLSDDEYKALLLKQQDEELHRRLLKLEERAARRRYREKLDQEDQLHAKRSER